MAPSSSSPGTTEMDSACHMLHGPGSYLCTGSNGDKGARLCCSSPAREYEGCLWSKDVRCRKLGALLQKSVTIYGHKTDTVQLIHPCGGQRHEEDTVAIVELLTKFSAHGLVRMAIRILKSSVAATAYYADLSSDGKP